ncbi:glycosyl transferase family 2 [Cellulomonas flavigena DSM 20109]|uniref:4,4'-diaponeurosporenoate glycosyltransferase n=1 Tax=Cellulomonas flavigena (strain ATCC 482 / DSM 20109 / BCRC 11376 / JCM 18109 / NBRC 3775 / NCIMB 8073 / NRS 134) TaxID=446466 RepID=D5UI00_CELFN|nr:glycosyltransferase [Cellulomonas flavigena]ADG73424.1 glycosyl transferase family 2 [Cellulomonas flavigena DSM 20109]
MSAGGPSASGSTAPGRVAPGPVTHVAVVVPVRDEEALVGACLASLDAARTTLLARGGRTADVVVVLDSCRDGTADVVARHVATHGGLHGATHGGLHDGVHGGVRVLEVEAADVGLARATGVAAALAASPASPDETWLACTDADSQVGADWLVEHVRLADAGADVVVGTVHPDPADLTPAQWTAWRATHVPGRPNGHVHGANLGVRASAYLRAGGFRAAREHEDVELVARLRASGAVIVASDVVDVRTSGRPVGRTPGGYAGHLAATLLRV